MLHLVFMCLKGRVSKKRLEFPNASVNLLATSKIRVDKTEMIVWKSYKFLTSARSIASALSNYLSVLLILLRRAAQLLLITLPLK